MNCYKHNESSAIGICKACNKAVCTSCAIDTGNGLACSEICETEVAEINKIIEISKNMYGVGRNAKKNLIPTSVMVHIFFTIIFLGWSLSDYILYSKINAYLIVMGVGFLLLGIITYRRTKQMSINC